MVVKFRSGVIPMGGGGGAGGGGGCGGGGACAKYQIASIKGPWLRSEQRHSSECRNGSEACLASVSSAG